MASSDAELSLWKQGAEAKLYRGTFLNKPCIIKERFPKAYRHPTLDKSLTAKRTKSEVRSMMRCRMNGILTPAIYFVDHEAHKIYMEHIVEAVTVKDYIVDTQQQHPDDFIKILNPLAEKIGSILASMHRHDIIHGDLTTSNILVKDVNKVKLELVMIDFGLGYIENVAEDKGVDLYVLERALLSTHPNTELLFDALLKVYKKNYGKGAQAVIDKLEEVRLRGRKRTMLG